MKRFTRILLVIVAILVAVIVFGPFLVPVKPLEGLRLPSALAAEESQFLSLPFEGTDGIDIHFRAAGDGEPAFVLLHGFASSLFTWDQVFDHFAGLGRTFAYDRPPFGLSERMTEGDWNGPNPYTPDAAIEQLDALLDTQGFDRAILVGNSAGGTVALRMALAHPERVAGLILVSPAVYSGGGTPPFLRPLLGTPQMRHLGPLVSRSFLSLGDSLETQAYHDPSVITEQQRERSRLGLQVEDWDTALWEFTRASQESDLASRLSEIDVPVLVVTGDDDRIVPTEQSVQLAGELPNATLEVIPACGHVAQEECEEVFLAAVDRWLAAEGLE
jgi:pimeloyl-ACP methyl ester carboxylesterase